MTALPRRMYRDPAEQLLEAEAETCKGCKHVEHWRDVDHCGNPKVKAVLAEKRCELYKESE